MRKLMLLLILPTLMTSGCGLFKSYHYDAQVETAVKSNHETTLENYTYLKSTSTIDAIEYDLIVDLENAHWKSMKNIFNAQKNSDSK